MSDLYKIGNWVLSTAAAAVAVYWSFEGEYARSAQMWACAAFCRVGTLKD